MSSEKPATIGERAVAAFLLHDIVKRFDSVAYAESIDAMVADHVRDLESKCKRYEDEAMALREYVRLDEQLGHDHDDMEELQAAWMKCKQLVAAATSPAPAPPPPAAARPPSTPACASTADGAGARSSADASASGETQ